MIIKIDDLENILKLHIDQFGSIISTHTYVGNAIYFEYVDTIRFKHEKIIMYYNIYLSNGNLERYIIQFYYDSPQFDIELTYVVPNVKSIILDLINRSYKIQNILSV